MATQFRSATAMPAMPNNQPSYQHHAYRKSAQYSPTGTPMNVSPTSPRDVNNLLRYHQATRPSKQALGVPAALRRTDFKQSPPKYDSACASPNSGWAVNGGFPSTNGGVDSPVAQVNNEDMHSIYNEMPMSPIAGPITRNHWQVCHYCFSYLLPVPALAPALSRAHSLFGGQLLRTALGVDPSSAVLNSGHFRSLRPRPRLVGTARPARQQRIARLQTAPVAGHVSVASSGCVAAVVVGSPAASNNCPFAWTFCSGVRSVAPAPATPR
jgi:hypothetical protein